ncbi:peptidase S1 and S6 chymotrypsin/Hap [Methylobacterium sp. 4-46]|uniref:S1 family peptidase n=1 Tax=unclassified Methylobacterium TaxID=2615210 RepID=UPI000152DCED|nr:MULTISPECIES: trypsin-like serine protease [Methylobacterium]ACA18781.1 peptidase S1 and S6 chymotrypsin/Hap [Methylobacterium sp. 4-46]WFT83630.1 trypsin-like serine protease [Methylobacterium nodulans]
MRFVSTRFLSVLAAAAASLPALFGAGGAGAVVLGEIERDPNGLRGSVVRIESTTGEMCSGSLIDQDLVLTAAHCVMHRAGYWVVVTDRGFRQRRLRAVAAAMHPDFVSGTTPEDQPGTDLAILKLSERLGPDFQPLTLRGGGGISAGDPVSIAGYGVVAENRRGTARVLRQARLVSLGDLQVANTVTVVADRRSLAETAGAGACLGDSGGPILKGSAGSYQLVGVVSWSSGAAQQGRVRTACGGFTAVTPIARHTDWISARAADLSRYQPGDEAATRSLRGNPADWTGGR